MLVFDWDATLKLAALQFRNDSVAEAQRTLKRYMDLYTPSAEALWLAVRIERKLGNKTQEALYNQQLRRNFPDSPEAKLLLQGQYE